MASTKQVVGNPTPRIEGELKVSGQAKYAVDVTLPGMLWGRLLRSPIASGKIKGIDTSKAVALNGVHAVLTGAELARRDPATLDHVRLQLHPSLRFGWFDQPN